MPIISASLSTNSRVESLQVITQSHEKYIHNFPHLLEIFLGNQATTLKREEVINHATKRQDQRK
jgi:hypothetical protein